MMPDGVPLPWFVAAAGLSVIAAVINAHFAWKLSTDAHKFRLAEENVKNKLQRAEVIRSSLMEIRRGLPQINELLDVLFPFYSESNESYEDVSGKDRRTDEIVRKYVESFEQNKAILNPDVCRELQSRLADVREKNTLANKLGNRALAGSAEDKAEHRRAVNDYIREAKSFARAYSDRLDQSISLLSSLDPSENR